MCIEMMRKNIEENKRINELKKYNSNTYTCYEKQQAAHFIYLEKEQDRVNDVIVRNLKKCWWKIIFALTKNTQTTMTQFFIHDGQNEKGPLDIEQLKLEQIKKDTPIWFEGLENWTTVGEVEELKNLFITKPTPPPLKKNIETIVTPPLSYTSSIDNSFEPTKKKSLKVSLIIAGIIAVIGIFGWLVYQNKSQADTLNQVQEQVTQQEQQQETREQQRLIDEQKVQSEKNRVNGVLTEKYMGYRNNWRSYITATNNKYTYSEIGGISNLQVVVDNQTDKNIDEVQVKVDYIKSNGGTYKSETVSVTNIGPNASKSVSAPSSNRGTSARMSIESITAKSFHFCYPYGMDGNKNFDPYFCK